MNEPTVPLHLAFGPKADKAPTPPAEGNPRQEEIERLRQFVEEHTATAATTEDMLAQRKQLFAIAYEVQRMRPTHAEAGKVLEKMVGMPVQLGRRTYSIREYLTRGGAGAIFVVEDIELPGQEYIMKVSLPLRRDEMFLPESHNAEDEARANRARMPLREIAAQYRLSHKQEREPASRNVKNILLKRDGGFPPVPLLYQAEFIPDPEDYDKKSPNRRIAVLLMEKMDGESLFDPRKSLHTFEGTPRELLELVRRLVQALQYVHAYGFYHSDIKIENILMTPDGYPIISDFGLAISRKRQRMQEKNQISGKMVYAQDVSQFGTPSYLPPEYEHPSAARDEYALGMSIMRLIYGRRIEDVKDRQTVFSSLDPLIQRISEVAEGLMQTNPEDRMNLRDAALQLTQLAA